MSSNRNNLIDNRKSRTGIASLFPVPMMGFNLGFKRPDKPSFLRLDSTGDTVSTEELTPTADFDLQESFGFLNLKQSCSVPESDNNRSLIGSNHISPGVNISRTMPYSHRKESLLSPFVNCSNSRFHNLNSHKTFDTTAIQTPGKMTAKKEPFNFISPIGGYGFSGFIQVSPLAENPDLTISGINHIQGAMTRVNCDKVNVTTTDTPSNSVNSCSKNISPSNISSKPKTFTSPGCTKMKKCHQSKKRSSCKSSDIRKEELQCKKAEEIAPMNSKQEMSQTNMSDIIDVSSANLEQEDCSEGKSTDSLDEAIDLENGDNLSVDEDVIPSKICELVISENEFKTESVSDSDNQGANKTLSDNLKDEFYELKSSKNDYSDEFNLEVPQNNTKPICDNIIKHLTFQCNCQSDSDGEESDCVDSDFEESFSSLSTTDDEVLIDLSICPILLSADFDIPLTPATSEEKKELDRLINKCSELNISSVNINNQNAHGSSDRPRQEFSQPSVKCKGLASYIPKQDSDLEIPKSLLERRRNILLDPKNKKKSKPSSKRRLKMKLRRQDPVFFTSGPKVDLFGVEGKTLNDSNGFSYEHEDEHKCSFIIDSDSDDENYGDVGSCMEVSFTIGPSFSDSEDDDQMEHCDQELMNMFCIDDPYNLFNCAQPTLVIPKSHSSPELSPEAVKVFTFDLSPRIHKSKSKTKVRFGDTEVIEIDQTDEDLEARRGPWVEMACDRMRFYKFISDIEDKIDFCLQPDHRTSVYRKLYEKSS